MNPTPIIIDLGGDGFDLTDAEHGVMFDITGRGVATLVSWTRRGSNDAFLALDRNGNGIIDDATELFGNRTPQPLTEHPNGFEALRLLDTNNDGVISSADLLFDALRLWIDSNHNGVSEPTELISLRDAGITSISLDYQESRRQDQYGNVFRYRSRVQGQGGPFAYDVFLVTAGAAARRSR